MNNRVESLSAVHMPGSGYRKLTHCPLSGAGALPAMRLTGR